MRNIVLKMRLTPTESQKRRLDEYMGAARKMQNLLLDRAKQDYEVWLINGSIKEAKPSVSHIALNYKVTDIKHSEGLEWMNDYPAVIYQGAAGDLASAFEHFFKGKGKTGFPKFKSRFEKNSIEFAHRYFSIISNKLYLCRFRTLIPVRWDKRELPKTIKSVRVTRNPSGHYYACFVCEVEDKPFDPSVKGCVGIDFGIKDLAVTSDGEVLKNPKYYIQAQAKLKRLQQKVCRRKRPKGQAASKGYLRACRQLACHHEHIANQRKDLLNKFTTDIVRRYKSIVIEDLAPANMVKNRHLAKAVSDSAFRMMRSMLEYKVVWSNTSTLVIADRWYPSTQLCSCCGNRPTKKLTLAVRSWTCEHCGAVHSRDFNASKNLQTLGNSEIYHGTESKGRIVLGPRFTQ